MFGPVSGGSYNVGSYRNFGEGLTKKKIQSPKFKYYGISMSI